MVCKRISRSDIHLGVEKPEPHFVDLALYLAFFPRLLQGPIERGGNLIPQLKAKYEFNYDNMRFRVILITWGLFKKPVIVIGLGSALMRYGGCACHERSFVLYANSATLHS